MWVARVYYDGMTREVFKEPCLSIFVLLLISYFRLNCIGFHFHSICYISFWQIEQADILKETKQFTYKDGSQFVFMDLVLSRTYRYIISLDIYTFSWRKIQLPPNSRWLWGRVTPNSQFGLYFLWNNPFVLVISTSKLVIIC